MNPFDVTAELEHSIMQSLANQKDQWFLSVLTHFAEPALVGIPTKEWLEEHALVSVTNRAENRTWIEQRGTQIGPAFSTTFPEMHVENSADGSIKLIVTHK